MGTMSFDSAHDAIASAFIGFCHLHVDVMGIGCCTTVDFCAVCKWFCTLS